METMPDRQIRHRLTDRVKAVWWPCDHSTFTHTCTANRRLAAAATVTAATAKDDDSLNFKALHSTAHLRLQFQSARLLATGG